MAEVAASDRVVLVLGTRNPSKGREMVEMIVSSWEPGPFLSQLDVRTLDAWPLFAEVVEDADTFAGNARKKASEAALATGHWTLADDSGLAVDALKGAPGVLSARYAGEPTDNAANNRKLLDALRETPDARRTAAFRCHLALADPTGAIRLESKGMCRGVITREPRGENGFGYDPLFLIPEYHRTFGELAGVVKRHLSHRARAFEQLRPGLIRLIAAGELTRPVDSTPASV